MKIAIVADKKAGHLSQCLGLRDIIQNYKKEKDVFLIAHSYQTPDIIYGVADSVYPSYTPNPDKKDYSYNPFRYSGHFSHFNNPETSTSPGRGSTPNSRHHNRFDPGAKYFDIYVLANYWSGKSGDNYTTSADKLETRIYGITVSANP